MTASIKLSTASVILLLTLLSFPDVSSAASADCNAQTDLPVAQCEVLSSIYAATDGANWTDNENWLSDAPCSWAGITCENGSVVHLNLASKGLVGEVPDLSALSDLRLLNLNFNQLSGPVPDLSALSKLTLADLYSNQFSGEIPSLSNLPVLDYLNLGSNQLSGKLAESLIALPLLTRLIVNSNNLSGNLPLSLIASSITTFIFDQAALCSPSQTIDDWLAAAGQNIDQLTKCWTLALATGPVQMATGDALSVYGRVQTPKLDSPLAVDLYISLLLPDGETEAFLVLTESGTEIQMGSSDPSNWTPAINNITLTPAYDSQLLPLFSYQLTGSEPSGSYTWRFRATSPNTQEVVNYTEQAIYFDPEQHSIDILAPATALIGDTVSFNVQSNTVVDGIIYHWEFEDGSTATGTEVSHSFTTVDRHHVSLTAKVNGQVLPISSHHNINIGRPLADTVYALAGTQFPPMTSVTHDVSWTGCELEWDVFDGKYFRLYLEASSSDNVDRQSIHNGLLFTDYIFESYSEIFTWDYLPSTPALNIFACDNINGAGTGTGGTFVNSDYFLASTGNSIQPKQFPAMVHELIHVWDFRGGAWINSVDPAHAFTGAMEPIIAKLLDTGAGISEWGGNASRDTAFPGEFLYRHYLHIYLNRYLSDPSLTWESYFTEPFLSYSFDEMPVPENKEMMLVPAGIIVSLFEMHGLEGLQKIFQEVESLTLAHPEWQSSTNYVVSDHSERAEIFMLAAAEALQLDVSDYFSYWKWPVDAVDLYMSRYPASDKIKDSDGDGFSPLQGDADDNDNTIYPLAPELADNKDNNLDGLVDENVYSEGIVDIVNTVIELPALIRGEIDDTNDTDSYEFTLTEAATVAIAAYSASSDSAVPYSDTNEKAISIFAGSLFIDQSHYTVLVHDQMSAPQGLSAQYFEAGTHTVMVSPDTTDSRTSNPGNYEIQLFVTDHDNSLAIDSLQNVLYP